MGKGTATGPGFHQGNGGDTLGRGNGVHNVRGVWKRPLCSGNWSHSVLLAGNERQAME